MKIIIIRHGQSELNALNEKKYQILSGQSESQLSSLGVEQASSLIGNPSLNKISRVFSSDSSRTIETAKIVMSEDIAIKQTSNLRERSLGLFDGKTLRFLESNPEFSCYFSDPKLRSFRHSFILSAPDGESYSDVYLRVKQFFEHVDIGKDETVAVFSHLCTIRCIFKYLLRIEEEEVFQLFIPNCHIVELINVHGSWKLITELPKRR